MTRSIQGFPRFAHLEPILTIGFVVERRPLPLNRTYGTKAIRIGEDAEGKDQWRGLMYMNKEARDQKDLLQRAAREPVMRLGWPRDTWRPAHVRISLYAFNCKSDAAANAKLVADAFEGLLYEDDNVVSWGEIPKPVHDGPKPRMEFVIDLLALRTPYQARKEELASIFRAIERVHRSRRRTPSVKRAVELAGLAGRQRDCEREMSRLVAAGVAV